MLYLYLANKLRELVSEELKKNFGSNSCYWRFFASNLISLFSSSVITDSSVPIGGPITIYIYIYQMSFHHQCFLGKGRSFTANSGTKAAVLLKGRSSTANSGTQDAVLLEMDRMDRCGSFPLLSTPPLSLSL